MSFVFCPTCNKKVEIDESESQRLCVCGEILTIVRKPNYFKDFWERMKNRLPGGGAVDYSYGSSRSFNKDLPNVIIAIFILLIIICSIPFFSYIATSSPPNLNSSSSEESEKAQLMRSYGATGSDHDLANEADSIKQFNEYEKRQSDQREEQTRKYLGGN